MLRSNAISRGLLSGILFIPCFYLFSCTSAEEHQESNDYSELIAAIDSVYNAVIDEGDPGAALLISYEDAKLMAKGYGLRNVETREPITASTNMRMASVSKQFTALCILTLVDQGKLSLQDDASIYLPYDIFKGITIENMMNHTSGLPDYYEYFIKDWDRSNILENAEVLEWLATGPDRAFEPGQDWQYSNTAYLMLALIVEKVSGTEFSVYAKENVFDKAGMSMTNYFNLAAPIEIPERSNCYEIDSTGSFSQVDGFFMNGVMGDGAVYTSLNDYFQYDKNLRANNIVSAKSHEIIFKPSSSYGPDSLRRHYALGWAVTDSTASHSGGWYGTNTFVRRYLNKPLTFAIFMNRNTIGRDKLIRKTDSLVNIHLH